MTLYELTGAYAQLQEMLDSGEIDQVALDELLASYDEAIEVKADNYAKVMRNNEATIEALKNEEKRLAEKRKSLENANERLKSNLKECMETCNKTKFKTDLFSFNIRANGGKQPVIVDVDTSKLADEFVIVEEKPNKEAILEYIQNTGDTSFAHLGERGTSLVIK